LPPNWFDKQSNFPFAIPFLPRHSGGRIGILGTNLTGATNVTFNGTPATFTVKTKRLITAAVPAGATTGNIQLTIPNARLTGNAAFTVRP
jgi:hypothetical protein